MKHAISFFLFLVVLVFQVKATDPTRLWGKYTGGSSTDLIRSSITDDAGNIYVTGYTETQGLATPGASQISHGGYRDSYLSKYNSNGVLLWSTYIGGSDEDRGTSIAILPVSNNVVVTGYTRSTNNISATGAHQLNYGGGPADCFLNCYTPSGTKLWATYYGGTGNDVPFAVSTNTYGDIFLSGGTTSSTMISTPNSFDPTYNNDEDGFLARFTENGVLVWSTYLGGSGSETMFASVTADSLIWVAGQTTSLELSTPGAHQTAKSGGTDGILYAFNRDGSRYWTTYFGNSGEDIFRGIGYSDAFGNVMPTGKIYLSGQTSSNTGIATPGAHQTSYGGNIDGLVATFNRNGGLEWATYIGGNGIDMSYGMAFNASTDLLITGGTGSFTGISTPGAFQTVYGGGSEDGFLMRFTNTGQRIWGTYYGGSGLDWGYHVSCNMEGDIFLAGYSTSPNQVSLPTTTNFGGYDGLIVKLFECPDILLFEQPVDTTTTIGASVTFTVVPTVFVTYQWQMDNGTGFVNLSNAGPYSGVNTDVLMVSNISPWMDNYKFRCLITSNSCTDTSDMATLSLSNVSVENLNRLTLNLYPNPNEGNFKLSDASGLSFNEITISDLSGRQLKKLTHQDNPATLSIPELAPGVYLITSKSNAGIGIKRMIVTK